MHVVKDLIIKDQSLYNITEQYTLVKKSNHINVMYVVKDFRTKVVLQYITDHTAEKGHINVMHVVKDLNVKEFLYNIIQHTML